MKTLGFIAFILFSLITIPAYADNLIISETKTSFLGNVIDPTMLNTDHGALSEPSSMQVQATPEKKNTETVAMFQAQPVPTQIVPVSHEVPSQKVVSKPSSSVTTYTGKLVKAAQKKGDKFHRYHVILADGDSLSLTTVRNYNQFVGKPVSITIQGTKKNFKILSFESGKKLPKTGPEYLIVLALIFGILGAFGIRKKSF